MQVFLLHLLIDHTDDIAVNKAIFAEINREAAIARANGTAHDPEDPEYYAKLIREDRDRDGGLDLHAGH